MKLGNDAVGTRVQALAKAQNRGTAAAVLSIVFSISVGASRLGAQTLDVIHGFGGNDGFNPLAGLVEGSDGALYGTTSSGGAHSSGVVFKLNKDGSAFQKLHDFDGGDGDEPAGGLIEGSDGALYGTTSAGGAFGYGVVFKLDKDGSGFSRLHDFSFSDGAYPYAGLVEASDGALYGTTNIGGASDYGVVFKLNKDGSGFLRLHDFSFSDATFPYGGVVEASDGALYGTTQHGGMYGAGVVFKLNKDGTGYLRLHHFNYSDGSSPHAGLVEASDGALYGTTVAGGLYVGGVVFKLNKDGSAFRKLHDFSFSEGSSPYAGLVEASEGALYGTTAQGGAYGYGIVFRLEDAGTGFLRLHDFSVSDGASPRAGLAEASDGALYGTTHGGGPDGGGVVFGLTLGCHTTVPRQSRCRGTCAC